MPVHGYGVDKWASLDPALPALCIICIQLNELFVTCPQLRF